MGSDDRGPVDRRAMSMASKGKNAPVVVTPPASPKELNAPSLGVTGLPINMLASAGVFGLFFFYIALVVAPGAVGICVLAVTLVMLFLFLARAYSIATHTRLELDEGGVRHAIGRKARYYPYSELGRTKVETSFLHAAELALVLRDRRDKRIGTIGFIGAPAAREALRLGDTIEYRIKNPPFPTPPQLTVLERRSRSFEDWNEAIRRYVQGDYRGAPFNGDLLCSVALEPTADVSVRAAAVYALGIGDDHSARQKLSQGLLARPALPPLVSVMARLARSDLVYDDVVVAIFEFLPLEDQRAIERMGAPNGLPLPA